MSLKTQKSSMTTTAEAVLDFTDEEIQQMLDNLDSFSVEEQKEIEKIADVLGTRQVSAACSNDLIAFCKHMQPDYIVGRHHRILANLLMNIAAGNEDRVCVNHSSCLFISPHGF